jgi:chromate transporter
VPFSEAFRYWLKLGFINFGGPAGQIALMHRDLVERRRWISEERFLHALNYCMLLPGPEAQQLAIYIGWLLHKTVGGLVAGAFFVLPSISVLLLLSYIYAAYGNLASVVGALAGVKPVVVAIVVEAVLKIGNRALKGRVHAVLAGLAFLGIFLLHIPFPLIVLTAGFVGLGGVRFWPGLFPTSSSGGNAPAALTATDDTAPPSGHTVPAAARAWKILIIGLLLWATPFVIVVVWSGWQSLYAQVYRFFTLAALVTFGGAYSVLAYVTQAAVDVYGWLSRVQAVDGLALAETTPGPLIMVLQFVGFLAGWNHANGMHQTTSAVVCALLTTYATFLPSFFFIFLGAPYIEELRGNRHLTAALSGITAAVVGVVLNLALVFGVAVIWPAGFAHGTDWFAATLSVLAFLALYRAKLDVLWVVLLGGVIGFGRSWLLSF